jgi:hypothetical protein
MFEELHRLTAVQLSELLCILMLQSEWQLKTITDVCLVTAALSMLTYN